MHRERKIKQNKNHQRERGRGAIFLGLKFLCSGGKKEQKFTFLPHQGFELESARCQAGCLILVVEDFF